MNIERGVRSRSGYSRLNDELVAVRGRGLRALDGAYGGRAPLNGITELERLAREYTSQRGELSRQERIEQLIRAAIPRISDSVHRRRVTLLFGVGGDSFASATELRKHAISILNEEYLSSSALVVRERRAFQSLELAIAELLEESFPEARRPSVSELGVQALLDDFDATRTERQSRFFLVPPRDTAFVNREHEIEEIAAATTGAEPHLVFLVGMGGSGKSATATEFAHAYSRRFSDGVVWVEPSLAKNEDVLYLLAQAFGRGRELLELSTLQRRVSFVQSLFSGRRTLVILNDVSVRTQLRPLLQAASASDVIVTTRNRSLAYGHPATLIAIAPLALDPALQLLEKSIGVARLSEEPDPAKSLCELTGFLPLALRIVGARVARSSARIAEYAARLHARRIGDELQLNSEPQLIDKELSVWSSLALSYDALTARLKDVFTATGVFEGGDFSSAALSSVLQTDEPTAARLIEDLYDLSLVDRSTSGRWRLHPLVFQFNKETSPPSHQLRNRLLAFVISLAEAAEQHMRTADQAIWLERLDLELGTITAALAWARHSQHQEEEGRILAALMWFWLMRGLPEHVRHRLSELAEVSLPAGTRMGVLRAACHVASDQANFVAGLGYANRWLEVSRTESNQRQIASALDRIAYNAWCLGDYDLALIRAEESLTAWRRVRDMRGIATAINIRGLVHCYQGSYVDAVDDFRSASRRWKTIGDEWGEATALNNVGEAERCLGRFAAARRHYEKALAMRIVMKDTWSIVNSLNNLAELERTELRPSLAQGYYLRAFNLALPMENLVSIATSVAGMATVIPPAQAPIAAEMIGAAEALLRRSRSRLGPANAYAYGDYKNQIASFLGQRSFAVHYQRGAKLDLPELAEFIARLRSGELSQAD